MRHEFPAKLTRCVGIFSLYAGAWACSIREVVMARMRGWLKALQASTQSTGLLARGAASRRKRADASSAATAVSQVTLVVYGWNNVEPGTLSWVFPSLAAAMSAVRAMKNAVRWAILAGPRETVDVEEDVEAARAHGLVLAEAL